jgi:CrcB protein
VSPVLPPVLLVAVGGVVGSLARAGLGAVLPPEPGGWSWAVLLANLLGAAALCTLLAQVPSREVRLLVGTGLLGGFTTFSGLTVTSVLLVEAGRPAAAAGYVVAGLGTLLGGGLAGSRLGRAVRRWVRG